MFYKNFWLVVWRLLSGIGITITSVAILAVVSLSPDKESSKMILATLAGLVVFITYATRLAPGIVRGLVRLLEERENKKAS